MSTSLLLKDHAAYLVLDRWDAKRNRSHYDERQIASLKRFLGAEVAVGRNFLFRDLWKYIAKDAQFFDTVFHFHLGGHPLVLFLREATKKTKRGSLEANGAGIDGLELIRVLETGIHRDSSRDFSYTIHF